MKKYLLNEYYHVLVKHICNKVLAKNLFYFKNLEGNIEIGYFKEGEEFYAFTNWSFDEEQCCGQTNVFSEKDCILRHSVIAQTDDEEVMKEWLKKDTIR